MKLNENEKLIVIVALRYMLANIDDVQECYEGKIVEVLGRHREFEFDYIKTEDLEYRFILDAQLG